MRVLIAHSFYRTRGGEDRYVELQPELLAGTHDVEVFTAPNQLLSHSAGTALRMLANPRVTRELLRIIRSRHIDLVHLHNPYPALGPSAVVAAQRAQIPIVQTVHNLRLRCPNGVMFTEGAICRRCEGGNYANAVIHKCFPRRSQATAYATALWSHRFVMGWDRKIDLFIAPSDFMLERLLHWGIPAHRVMRVRNWGAESATSPAPPGEGGIYLGRLTPEKGLAALLEALVLAGDPPFRIVGTGPMEGELRTRARELGLANVVVTGAVDAEAARTLLLQSRYLVVPSIWEENAPLAAIEAMFAARPLVVSAIGGLPELVAGGAGIAVRAGDAAELAGAMADIARLEQAEAMGAQALRFARTELGRENHLVGLNLAYERAVSRRA